MKRPVSIVVFLTVLLVAGQGCIPELDVLEIKTPTDLRAVDLGLPAGVKWCSQNLGAGNQYDLGDTYAWGRTTSSDIILSADDDVVSATMGSEWRMPTQWEFEELLNYCDWEFTQVSRRIGYTITSKINSNSIFIPIKYVDRGFMYGKVIEDTPYWTSCASGDNSMAFVTRLGLRERSRNEMLFIRPVQAGRKKLEGIEITNIPASAPAGSTFLPIVAFTPADALDKRLNWESSDKSIADFDEYGRLIALCPGTVEVTVSSPSGAGHSCNLTVSDYLEPKAIDLGLPSGIMWASHNIGSVDERKPGLRFAWAETNPIASEFQEQYDREKYTDDPGNCFLRAEDDAATVIFGDGWRIPSTANFTELLDNCDISSIDDGDVKGYVFRSKINGNTIFFPYNEERSSEMVGDIHSIVYWTSKSNTATSSNTFCCFRYDDIGIGAYDRKMGLQIRPVFGGAAPVNAFTVMAREIDIYVGETAVPIQYNLSGPDHENDVNWSCTPNSVASVDNTGRVKALHCGTATIRAATKTGETYTACVVNVPGHRGMVPVKTPWFATKWASCNLGAETEEEIGWYLAFGETAPKETYTKDNYAGVHGDPVTALLGEHWRMPTSQEMTELMRYVNRQNMNNNKHCKEGVWGNIAEPFYTWWLTWWPTPHVYDNSYEELCIQAGGYMDGDIILDRDHIYYWCTAPDSSDTPYYVFDVQLTDGTFDIQPVQVSTTPHLGMLVRPVWVD